ncbi:MAG: acetate--CoA ligase family protein, partial [Alphaproteobacteria bacterium]
LLHPKTVAIVGASETGGGGWPRAIYQNLEFAGFPVKPYLINPRRDELWGEKVYPNFAALPEKIDLALTIVPAEVIPDVLAEGAAHGLKAALVYASRFGEGGDEVGAARAEKIAELCQNGLRICGPNCMGALALPNDLLFYPATRVRGLLKGPVGVVFQSGGTFMFWMARAAACGIGMSYAVSSGNEIDLDLADYINFLVEDEDTKIITCMVEGIRRADAFMAAAEKALAAGKPILMVKVGRSEAGKAAAHSHTGALASDDEVLDAVCRKYGIIRCISLDDMVQTCLAFLPGRYPDGPRIGMAGFSGGGKGLFLDYAADEGAEIATISPATADAITPLIDDGVPAENPVDCGAGIAYDPPRFAEVCKIVAADPAVDLMAVQGQLPALPDDPADPTVFSGIKESTDKPVVAFIRVGQNITEAGLEFQEQSGVPFIQGLPETVRAMQALVKFGDKLRTGAPAMPAANGNAGSLEGDAFDKLLNGAGLTLPASAFGDSPEAAAAKAAGIGFPVALKIVSPQASHKTEIGGVALNLMDEAAVRDAAADMKARLEAIDPAAETEGFLVQEMVSGTEMILGVREDPQFGPFVIAGLGGIMVEAMHDVSFRMLPVSPDEARAMLDELRGKAVLGAFRGAEPRDIDALVRAICGLSEIFLDHRTHLADLEVNPLIVLAEGKGVRAVDVRPVRKTPNTKDR